MRDDFEMIYRHIDKKAIKVIPMADVHLGALEHCKKEWEEFCKTVESDPDMYLILGGDLINNSVRNSVANPFDEVIRPMEQKKRIVEMLKPIKDRILCCVSGNHEYRTVKDSDQDLTYDIMSKLDLEDIYRPNIAFLQIGMGEHKNGERTRTSCTFNIVATHGTGGGIYTGATVNRNERFGNVIEGMDALCVGHTHKGTVTKPSKIVIDSHNKIVTVKNYTVISMVSWLNYGGYATRKMLQPSQVAEPQIMYLSGNPHGKKLEVRW